MAKFRDVKARQKFASVHASIQTTIITTATSNRRDLFEQYRSTALVEWRQLAA